MDSMSIPAHFDGNQIILDEPVELEPDARLIVTVLPDQQTDEHTAWVHVAKHGLAHAYADDEVEYTIDSIKELNPEYAGR